MPEIMPILRNRQGGFSLTPSMGKGLGCFPGRLVTHAGSWGGGFVLVEASARARRRGSEQSERVMCWSQGGCRPPLWSKRRGYTWV